MKTNDTGEHRIIENISWGLRHTPEDEDFDPSDIVDPINLTIYSSNEDPVGISAQRLHNLSIEDQVPYLTYWFLGRYEDPAEETPYNGREGGYQYIHGGPFNAREEMEQEFAGLVSDETLDLATEDVEQDGLLYWAPSPNHPDRADEGDEHFDERPREPLDEVRDRLRSGSPRVFGSREELAARADILRELENFDNDLPPDEVVHGGPGHNNPPPDQRFSREEIAEMRSASKVLIEEFQKPEPTLEVVVEKTSFFQQAIKWLGRKVDLVVDKTIEWGVPLAIAAAATHAPTIFGFVQKIIDWLLMVLPFI